MASALAVHFTAKDCGVVSLGERRRQLEVALAADPTLCNVAIARRLDCHPGTVGEVRARLEHRGVIPRTPRRVDREGRWQQRAKRRKASA